jgi:transcriptional regulator with XRE-family HTH domain
MTTAVKITGEHVVELAQIEGFGKKVKYLRTLAGLKQTELAELAGVHYLLPSKVENSLQQPNYSTLCSFARAFRKVLKGFTADLLLD